MRLYKRGAIYWYEFTVKGERYRKSTQRTDRAEAERVMSHAHKALLDQHQFGIKPTLSVEEGFDRVLKGAGEATGAAYRLAKRKWLGMDTFGERGLWSLPRGCLLHELTDELLEDHITERRGEGLKPNSINAEVRALKVVYNAHRKRYRANPDLTFRTLPPFVKTRFLTEAEEAAVQNSLDKDTEGYRKAGELYVFLRDTGARISEALNCRMADLNLKDGVFEVYRIKTKSLSVVPLSGRVIDMLKRKDNQAGPFESMTRAVKLLRSAIDAACNDEPRVVEQRGAATIHTLRDTYASALVRKGLSLHELAKMLGHTSAAMSAKYGHLESSDVVEKVRRLMA